jgi:membrane protein YqaA with SNARE-associated domain
LAEVTDWVFTVTRSPLAAVALFLLSYVESIISPVTTDPLLVAMGATSPTRALLYASLATTASVLGGMTSYLIGDRWGRGLTLRLFGAGRAETVERFYNKYDVWAVILAGFTPLPYKVFAIWAGVFRLKRLHFIVGSIIGRGIRFFTIGVLIHFFGESVLATLQHYRDWVAVGFLVVVALSVLVVTLFSARRPQRA